jgi:hypothetical protein
VATGWRGRPSRLRSGLHDEPTGETGNVLRASLQEDLEEPFTVSRLGLIGSLRRCLGTMSLSDNGRSAARERMRR